MHAGFCLQIQAIKEVFPWQGYFSDVMLGDIITCHKLAPAVDFNE